jgi:hypothetical protein
VHVSSPDYLRLISLISSPGNRAISTVNLLKNDIGIEQAKALAGILKEHPTLKSLCGNSGEETELDMSGKRIGADGAIMLAPEIAGNRALSKLDASDNGMFGKEDKAGITAWADALKANTSITELNLAKNKINAKDTKILAPAISDNGALMLLNLSSNNLKAAGAKVVVEAIKVPGVTDCTIAVVLAPFL